jgi:hypothetical protein
MSPRYPAADPGGAGPAVHIDRLDFRVTGLDEAAARTLARLVAEGLAPDLVWSAANAGLDHLRIEVTAGAADQGHPELLARRITSELGRALAHGRGPGGSAGEARP